MGTGEIMEIIAVPLNNPKTVEVRLDLLIAFLIGFVLAILLVYVISKIMRNVIPLVNK